MLTFNLILGTFLAVLYLNMAQPKPVSTPKPPPLPHFGNYQEALNGSFLPHCPQLSPNYNNEFCMSFEEFKNNSFFACDSRHNKAKSTPSDYNIRGTYSNHKWTCDPTKKDKSGRRIRDRRDEINYNELRRQADLCGAHVNKSLAAYLNCPPPPTLPPTTTPTTTMLPETTILPTTQPPAPETTMPPAPATTVAAVTTPPQKPVTTMPPADTTVLPSATTAPPMDTTIQPANTTAPTSVPSGTEMPTAQTTPSVTTGGVTEAKSQETSVP